MIDAPSRYSVPGLTAASNTRRHPALWLVLPVLLFLGALALRLWQIGHESLWLDEGYTLLFSRMPLTKLILVGGAHEHPPLYYLLVHTVLALRDAPLVPRYISAVAGAGSVAAIYFLGRRMFGMPAGLVAALITLISPFHLWYSQDGRAYELAGLTVLLSYLALYHALDRPRFLSWLLYAVLSALALYTEYTTLLVLLPQAILWQRARAQGNGTDLIRAWLGAGALFSPWLGTVLLDAKSIAGNYWIPTPTVATVTGTLLQFLGLRTPCPSPPCVGAETPFPLLVGHETSAAAVTLGAVLVVGLVALRRHDFNLQVLTAWVLVPFAFILLLAVWWSLYLDRVFLDCSLALYLLVGAGLTRFWRRHYLPALVATIALLPLGPGAVINDHLMQVQPTNPNWKSAMRDLAAVYRPSQAVAFVPGVVRQMAAAYLPPNWHARHELSLWYHAYLDVPGWESRYAGATDDQLRDLQLRALARGQRQIWLITEDYTGLSDTREWFAQHGFHLLLSQMYRGDTRIELWDRRPPAAVGPLVLGRPWSRWQVHGTVYRSTSTATERGQASLSTRFSVRALRAYTVAVHYRGLPPAAPTVLIRVYNRRGVLLSRMTDGMGNVWEGYPHAKWYDLPANGAWVSEPFGLITPPGSVSATITLSNAWGWSSWRHIDVYRQR